MEDKGFGLYIHIPFCKKKCNYCDFISYINMEYFIPQYIETLKKEMDFYKDYCSKRKIRTIYIGGGTPTILQPEQLEHIIESALKTFRVYNELEISIEANPDSITKEKLHKLKNAGVNRLSIGLQAYQTHLLKNMGRIHSPGQFERAFLAAREEGFDNINVDLIFGLPGQTGEQWEETLKKVTALRPEHVSAYSLKIEEGTLLYDQYKSGIIKLPEEEKERGMYYFLIDFLTSRGYNHYEISNFAFPGKECRHNILYWKNKEYIGIGAASHSHFCKKRYHNEEDLEKYIEVFSLKNRPPIKDKESISKGLEISETIIMNLRLTAGLDKIEFFNRFGVDIKDLYRKEIELLENSRLIEETQTHIKLTKLGLDFANEVFVNFIP
ncbi:MAG TPA: oxygen-independent coproporphyrinogen III oxidase [Thermoanaerobacterales bacterium]|nr:oxygen-independent coproporphyrinogen III oxidase [Thermoanaerobacterales bacterium]